MARARIEQPQLISGNHDVPCFIQPPPASPAEHLKNLVWLEQLLGLVAAVRFGSQGDTAQRKVNSGSQAHSGDDHPELPRLGERFDDSGPCAIAQTAMVI